MASVKASIESAHGHAAANQKLIFSGQILSDDKTMSDYDIKEKDFLVVMVSKPKVKKPVEPAAEKPAEPATPAKPKEEAAAAGTQDATPAPAASETPADGAAPAPSERAAEAAPPATPAQNDTTLQPGSFLSGAELETAINSIVEMGFPKSDVQRAMRMSFNNPDRAVEHLMNGLPEETAPSRPTATAPPPATPATPTPAAARGAAPSGNLFEQAAAMHAGQGAAPDSADASMLAEDDGHGRQVLDIGNPQVLGQLRTLLEQNPAALQPLVQALVQSNPQLAEAMSADPEGVLRMLAGEGMDGEDSFEVPTLQQLADEDRTQVEQIMAMGIPESKAIEAYFMCGRNLEMAVQYYFEVCKGAGLPQNPQDFED